MSADAETKLTDGFLESVHGKGYYIAVQSMRTTRTQPNDAASAYRYFSVVKHRPGLRVRYSTLADCAVGHWTGCRFGSVCMAVELELPVQLKGCTVCAYLGVQLHQCHTVLDEG